MFIQTQDTPNPETLKFIPGIQILPEGTMSFNKANADYSVSPLVEILMQYEGVKGVFLAQDFLTVTKEPSYSWETLKVLLLSSIMDYIVAGYPIILEHDKKIVSNSQSEKIEDSEIVQQIKELIETRVRPAVAQDGGDIVFHNFENGVVYLELHGSCSGCPSSIVTLKQGIENMLKHYIPEVESVEAVN